VGDLRLRGVGNGRRWWVILWRLLIATLDIDDDHALPDKELLKAALNGLHGFAEFFGRIVARDAHEEVHFADAHELAKQIVRQESILSQVAQISLSSLIIRKDPESKAITQQDQRRRS
jgi:hypothetical protein